MLKIYIILKNNNIRVCEKALWKQDVNLMRHKGCHSWALIGWRVAVWNLWLAHRVASLWQTPPLSVMTSLRRSSRWTFPCGGEREREALPWLLPPPEERERRRRETNEERLQGPMSLCRVRAADESQKTLGVGGTTVQTGLYCSRSVIWCVSIWCLEF